DPVTDSHSESPGSIVSVPGAVISGASNNQCGGSLWGQGWTQLIAPRAWEADLKKSTEFLLVEKENLRHSHCPLGEDKWYGPPSHNDTSETSHTAIFPCQTAVP
ncbi:hypothetical protein CBL_21368, partial [Carabus blaptoides fortunei]